MCCPGIIYEIDCLNGGAWQCAIYLLDFFKKITYKSVALLSTESPSLFVTLAEKEMDQGDGAGPSSPSQGFREASAQP